MVGVMKAKPRLSYATLASTLVGLVLISGCVREGAALVYQTKPSPEEHIPPASAVKKESEAGMAGRDTFDKMTLWMKETQLRGAKDLLKKVKTWFYFLHFDLDAILEDLIDSAYDMVVIEPIFTEKENEDYNIKEKEKAGSLEQIIASGERKYGREFDPRLFLEQLIYLKDMEKIEIRFLKERLTVPEIEKFFEGEVKKIKL